MGGANSECEVEERRDKRSPLDFLTRWVGWNMEEQWGRICLGSAEQCPLHSNRRTRGQDEYRLAVEFKYLVWSPRKLQNIHRCLVPALRHCCNWSAAQPGHQDFKQALPDDSSAQPVLPRRPLGEKRAHSACGECRFVDHGLGSTSLEKTSDTR